MRSSKRTDSCGAWMHAAFFHVAPFLFFRMGATRCFDPLWAMLFKWFFPAAQVVVDIFCSSAQGGDGALLARLRRWVWGAMKAAFLAGDRAGLRGLAESLA